MGSWLPRVWPLRAETRDPVSFPPGSSSGLFSDLRDVKLRNCLSSGRIYLQIIPDGGGEMKPLVVSPRGLRVTAFACCLGLGSSGRRRCGVAGVPGLQVEVDSWRTGDLDALQTQLTSTKCCQVPRVTLWVWRRKAWSELRFTLPGTLRDACASVYQAVKSVSTELISSARAVPGSQHARSKCGSDPGNSYCCYP